MKTTTKRKLTALLGILMCGSLLAGCGTEAAPQKDSVGEKQAETTAGQEAAAEGTTITYWYWADNTEYSQIMQEIAEEFNKTNGKGITVAAEEYPYDNGAYIQNMMTAVLGGGGPDVACFKMDSVPLYNANNLLTDMNPYVEGWEEKNDVDEGLWKVIDTVSGEGKISVIPFAVDVPYCYYRPSMFREAGLEVPKTYDEFLNACRALTKDTDGDGQTDVYGFGLRGSGGHAIWASFVYAQGGSMEDLSSPEAVQAMQDVMDLYQNGFTPPSATTDGFNEIIGNFKAGITAMTVHHIGSSGDMQEALGEDVAAFVIPGNTPEQTWAQLGETSNVILSSCKNPEAAFEWVKYLTAGDGQYAWNSKVGKIPVATSLRSNEAFSNPFYQASFDALPHTGVLPMLDTLDEFISTAFPNELQAALLGQETAEEACGKLHAALYGN